MTPTIVLQRDNNVGTAPIDRGKCYLSSFMYLPYVGATHNVSSWCAIASLRDAWLTTISCGHSSESMAKNKAIQ